MNKYLLSLVLILLCIDISAQDTTAISTENQEVVKRFEASILQAEKKELEVVTEDKTVSPLVFRYDLTTEKIVDFDKPDPEVRALGYQHENKEKAQVKNGYLYGAYGTHSTLNTGGAYHYYIEDWLEAGFKVDHLGAGGEQESVELDYRRTKANLYAGYSFNPQTKIKLTGFGDVRRHDWTDFESSVLEVPYNSFGGKMSFHFTSFEELGLAVRMDPSYTVTTGYEPLKENIISLPANILKSFSNNLSIELPASYDIHSIEVLDTADVSGNDLVLQPFVRYKKGKVSAKAGVNYFKADNSSDFYPRIELSITDVIENLTIDMWVTSSYQRNTLTYLGDRFSFFPTLSQAWSGSTGYFKNFNKTNGLRGSYTYNNFSFNLSAEYETIKDGANPFLNSSVLEIQFKDWYEIRLLPSITYTLSEDIEFGLWTLFRSFEIQNSLDRAELYLPNIEIGFSGQQKLFSDKLCLEERLTYNSSRQLLQRSFPATTTIIDVDEFIDLSISIKYDISPTIGIFAHGANLLGSEYQVWYPINALKQQIWGGLKFKI